MSQKSKLALIYWKTLDKDNVSVREFDNEHDLLEFAESKRKSGHATLVCELNYCSMDGEKTYKLRNYGAYPFFKNWYKYVGLFLISMIICLILTWKW